MNPVTAFYTMIKYIQEWFIALFLIHNALYATAYAYHDIVYNVFVLFVHLIQCYVIVAFIIFIVINSMKHDQNII